MFNLLEKNLQDIADMLEHKLDELLPRPDGFQEDRLYEAMRYASLDGGKRLRPFLCVTCASLFGVSTDCSIQTAAALEMIHCYSLVHDDLPVMDNDDYRRGKLSCHKKFDEATAVLTGDALLTYAFEVLSLDSTHLDPRVRVDLINVVARAAGFYGLVGGQVLDVILEKKPTNYTEVVRLQRLKTGALFVSSCEAGAVLGKASKSMRNALKAYANNIGLAFQITDDLLDAEGTRKETGKAVGKDQKLGKATLISCIGIDKAREQAQMLADQALDHIKVFDRRAEPLRDLAKFVVTRTS